MTAMDYFGFLVTRFLALTDNQSAIGETCCELYEQGCRLIDLAVHHPLSLCVTKSEIALAVFSHSHRSVFGTDALGFNQFFGASPSCQMWISTMDKCPGCIRISNISCVDQQELAKSNEKALSFILSQINVKI